MEMNEQQIKDRALSLIPQPKPVRFQFFRRIYCRLFGHGSGKGAGAFHHGKFIAFRSCERCASRYELIDAERTDILEAARHKAASIDV
jgi:hypothetical protein